MVTRTANLAVTAVVLAALGLSETEVKRLTETFNRLDENRLYKDYQYYTDVEKVRAKALSQAKELEELFMRDVEELPDGDGPLISAERRDGRRSANSPRKDG